MLTIVNGVTDPSNFSKRSPIKKPFMIDRCIQKIKHWQRIDSSLNASPSILSRVLNHLALKNHWSLCWFNSNPRFDQFLSSISSFNVFKTLPVLGYNTSIQMTRNQHDHYRLKWLKFLSQNSKKVLYNGYKS